MKKISYLFLFLFGSVFADNSDGLNSLTNDLAKKSSEPNYFMMLFGLFLVIGPVYLTAFIYQKLLKIKLSTDTINNNVFKVFATIPSGQNKNPHIVKVNNEFILIGSTQNSITHIKDLDYFGNEE